MPHQPIRQLVPALLPKDGRRDRARQQPLRPNPADGFLLQCLCPADPHRFGDARIEVSRLNERQQPRFQTGRPVRREVFERDARVREFADERGIVRHRRHDHDPDGRDGIEQPADQAGPKMLPAAPPWGIDTITTRPACHAVPVIDAECRGPEARPAASRGLR